MFTLEKVNQGESTKKRKASLNHDKSGINNESKSNSESIKDLKFFQKEVLLLDNNEIIQYNDLKVKKIPINELKENYFSLSLNNQEFITNHIHFNDENKKGNDNISNYINYYFHKLPYLLYVTKNNYFEEKKIKTQKKENPLVVKEIVIKNEKIKDFPNYINKTGNEKKSNSIYKVNFNVVNSSKCFFKTSIIKDKNQKINNQEKPYLLYSNKKNEIKTNNNKEEEEDEKEKNQIFQDYENNNTSEINQKINQKEKENIKKIQDSKHMFNIYKIDENQNEFKFNSIYNGTNNNESTTDNYSNFRKEIPDERRRGRKTTRKNRRVHRATDDDNLLRKIQVHFLSFCVTFSNDVILSIFPKKKEYLFKGLDYQLKKNVNLKYISFLKSKSIGEIVQMRVSPKNKSCAKEVNQVIYQRIISNCPILESFFSQSYLEIFFRYYYCYNLSRLFIVCGREVKLSKNTRTFLDLERKNPRFKNLLEHVVDIYFINGSRKIKKINFKIKRYV